MWAKLDDALLDHPKILQASGGLGQDGRVKALGTYALGLLYANKHLTDGFLSRAAMQELRVSTTTARIMVAVGLWSVVKGGYKVHDFHDHNPKASDVQAKRKADRERKRKGGENRHSGNGRG